MKVHDFRQNLAASHVDASDAFWRHIYTEFFGPSFSVRRNVLADSPAQRAGIDCHLVMTDGSVVRVEEKCRPLPGSPSDYPNDILLEIWSNQARRTPGWANPKKALACDYIAYVLKLSRIGYLLPYPLLRRVMLAHGDAWYSRAHYRQPGYRLVSAPNHGYWTENVAVPYQVVLDAIPDCRVARWPKLGAP